MANATTTICTFQTAEIKSGQRFFSNSGDASMGYDLPAAIGACVAKGGAKTVCLAGDGSVMMNLQELQTIVHHRLPIKIFIINNDGYVSIKQTQHNFFNGRECGAGRDSGVSTPDFVKIGRAFGLKTLRTASPDTLLKTIREAMDGDEPVLCEIVVDENETFVPKLASRQNPDGTISSPSLEDMYPFLPRDEFADNMLPFEK
jgi:acetolactate synthase-1/2/3 large subunit